MVDAIIHDQILQMIVFQVVILLIILSNAYILHRARKHAAPSVFPMVSILVPARNEERNIERCIASLLAQDYPSFEILALDDQSSDSTRLILEQIASSNPRLKVLIGSPPSDGWLGKNWACTQLAQQAQGDLLFFTDADTVHEKQALRAGVTALIGERADLLTGFPRQELGSWGERLLVPFFSWASLCFNLLWLQYRLRLPAFSTAVGQMLLFRRDAYNAIGGHRSVGTSIVDDKMLASGIRAAGLRWRVAHISDLVSCRMYDSSSAAFNGFVKNYFAAFDFHLIAYLFVFIWLAFLFWKPLILLFLIIFGYAPMARLDVLIVCIGLSLLLWLIPYAVLRISYGLALLYPITILANEVVAFQSLWASIHGKLTWKDREISRPRWKWL